jgi:hypothetical protein
MHVACSDVSGIVPDGCIRLSTDEPGGDTHA